MGLVGVLVTGAGIAIALASMSLWQQRLVEQRLAAARFTVRDRLAEQVKLQAEMAPALRASANLAGAGNVALRRCLGLAAGGCSTTNPAAPMAFSLVMPVVGLTPPTIPVAGLPSAPVRYDRSGMRTSCTPSANCPFEAITYFWATCPGGAATCAAAHSISVRRRIRVAASVNFTDGPRPNPVPNDRDWADPTFDSSVVLRTDILEEENTCNAGARMIGLDANREILCECIQGFVEDGVVDGKLTCKPEGDFCKDRQAVFQGFKQKPDGTVDPICVVPVESQYECRPIRIDSRNGSATCPGGAAGDWKMRALHVGSDCYVEDDNTVTCPDVTMTCCRLRRP